MHAMLSSTPSRSLRRHACRYSGHVLRLRHDIMFNGTEFDAWEDEMRESTERERRPDYKDQLLGLPTMTANPQGARKAHAHLFYPERGLAKVTEYIAPR